MILKGFSISISLNYTKCCAQIWLTSIARYRGGNLYKGKKGGRRRISGRYDTSFYFPTNLYSPPHISIQISWSLPLEIGGYLDSHFPLYPLYRRFTVSVGKYWIEKGEDWSHFLDISAEIGGEWVQDERAERKRKGNSAMIYKSGRKVWIFEDVRRLTIRGNLFFDW